MCPSSGRTRQTRYTPNLKPQTPNPRPQTPDPKPQTPNPKPQTPNPKFQTPNPKPQTPNPKPQIKKFASLKNEPAAGAYCCWLCGKKINGYEHF